MCVTSDTAFRNIFCLQKWLQQTEPCYYRLRLHYFFFFFLHRIREAMEKEWQPTPVFLPRKSLDRGACRATVHRVARVRHDLVTKPTKGRESTAQRFSVLRKPLSGIWTKQGMSDLMPFLVLVTEMILQSPPTHTHTHRWFCSHLQLHTHTHTHWDDSAVTSNTHTHTDDSVVTSNYTHTQLRWFCSYLQYTHTHTLRWFCSHLQYTHRWFCSHLQYTHTHICNCLFECSMSHMHFYN